MRTVLLSLLVPVMALAQAPGQPRLELDASRHDFGKLGADTEHSHRFRLSNQGSATLIIARLHVTCGCTTSVVGKTELAPGESTDLEVTFKTIGLAGKAFKTVDVLSNDPVHPVQTLTIEAEVLQEVTASAEWVFFRDLTGTAEQKASVRIHSETSQPIEVTDVVLSEAPWLGVATRSDGNDIWVDLELLAKRLPPEKMAGSDTITLHLSNPRRSVVPLKVRWERRLPVQVRPARLAWDQPAGQELRAALQVRHQGQGRFKILAARSSWPALQVTGVGAEAASLQKVQVTVGGSVQPGTYREKLTLTLDLPGYPEVEVPVAVVLRDPKGH